MKNQFCYVLLLMSLLSIQAFTPKHDIPAPLVKKITKVFDLGRAGYKNLDAKKLVAAAKILIKNPEIQQFVDSLAIDEGSLKDGEQNLSYQNFFNPEKLLLDAEKLAPVDAKILKWRIKKLKEDLPNYNEMSAQYKEKGGDIQVKNYVIYSKNSKTIFTSFKGNKKIILSVRVGNDLRLSVLDKKTKKKVGKSTVIGDARMISFTAKPKGEYQIKIKNVANQPNDCLLMIETK